MVRYWVGEAERAYAVAKRLVELERTHLEAIKEKRRKRARGGSKSEVLIP